MKFFIDMSPTYDPQKDNWVPNTDAFQHSVNRFPMVYDIPSDEWVKGALTRLEHNQMFDQTFKVVVSDGSLWPNLQRRAASMSWRRQRTTEEIDIIMGRWEARCLSMATKKVSHRPTTARL